MTVADVGPVVRLGRSDRALRLEASARIGRFWGRGNGWNSSAGLGIRFGRGHIGGMADLRYHAFSGDANTDQVVGSLGVQLRF